MLMLLFRGFTVLLSIRTDTKLGGWVEVGAYEAKVGALAARTHKIRQSREPDMLLVHIINRIFLTISTTLEQDHDEQPLYLL